MLRNPPIRSEDSASRLHGHVVSFLAACSIIAILFVRMPPANAQAVDEARLLRFPAIHGEQIVFTYAGNLYTVAANGRRRPAS